MKAVKIIVWVFLISHLAYLQNVIAQPGKATATKAQKDSIVFQFKAQQQSWTVPEGVTLIHADAYGAQGGGANGGKGGRVKSDIAVTPGTKFIINVGAQPSGSDGGFNGGGKGCGNGTGGGGATDIRVDGSDFANRILVAGGGGGFGYGGSAGAGGGLTGGDSKYDESVHHIAKGGTQEAGGSGARAYFSKPGEAGKGGEGIDNHGNCSNGAMGGGGGGYFGGGGSGAGGGGGGSSYTNDKNKNVVHAQGVHEGHGKLILYWDKPVK